MDSNMTHRLATSGNSVPTSKLLSQQQVMNSSETSLRAPDMQDCFVPNGVTEESEASQGIKEVIPCEEDSLTHKTCFTDLPVEILELILDYVSGTRLSIEHSRSYQFDWRKSMTAHMRHQIFNLAAVSPIWRQLIQQRIYRLIRIRGSIQDIERFHEWFQTHSLLQKHVHHVQLWIPAWEDKPRYYLDADNNPQEVQLVRANDVTTQSVLARLRLNIPSVEEHVDDHVEQLALFKYARARSNAPLEVIFQAILNVLPRVRVLTIESGHCKSSPMVHYFAETEGRVNDGIKLPILSNIEIFVIKDAWNLMRTSTNYQMLAESMPNLKEIKCSYTEPAAHNYLGMAQIVPNLPTTLTHLTLDLEPVYSRSVSCADVVDHVLEITHLCSLLGKFATHLQVLNYSGCICPSFFEDAREAVIENGAFCGLRSIDFTVRNFCHTGLSRERLPGPLHVGFIQGFESTLAAGMRSLGYLRLDYFRMRFVTIGLATRYLDPYFEMKDNKCTGLWSHALVDILKENRPEASYVELSSGLESAKEPIQDEVPLSPRNCPTIRPLSLHTMTYLNLAVHELKFPSSPTHPSL